MQNWFDKLTYIIIVISIKYVKMSLKLYAKISWKLYAEKTDGVWNEAGWISNTIYMTRYYRYRLLKWEKYLFWDKVISVLTFLGSKYEW